jgi:energy-coupling factor transport system ATP-binding protein
VTDLWSWYSKELPVLKGIDLAVRRGDFLAVVGANGSGKTTLVKHFNGLLRPRRGGVWLDRLDTARRSTGELARQVGFLFQHPEQQIFCPTVLAEVAFGPRNMGLSTPEVNERVDASLQRFDLAWAADLPPAILSYGLRRRVTLASLAAMDAPILVLDEPTVGLDARGLRVTFDWIEELHAAGRTIVLVSHDMAIVAQYATRVILLDGGRLIADGGPAEFFRQPELLASGSLEPPPLVRLAEALRSSGVQGGGLTVEGFCDELVAVFRSPT